MEVVAVYGLIGFDDDIVSLADADEEILGREWLDSNEIGRDHCHVVAVEADFEVVICSSVHESKTVFLAFFDSGMLVLSSTSCIDVCAVDEDIVGSGTATSQASRELPDSCEGWLIEPVRDRHYSKVSIVVGCSRPINDDGAPNPV